MGFLNAEHENKLMELIQRDGTHPKDKERISLFYNLSGNADLYAKSDFIYDFKNHQIELDCLLDSRVDFYSSSRALIRLAYNLYNGYQDDMTTPIDLLSGLDADNYLLALESIDIRLGYSKQVQASLDDEELEL
ncbi:MAG: hypothetical protein CVU84_06815 [Firmicutes bacterium HGW-Firmicutes-1]|jgi:hypothetical protein|nr:MAG: hypothetical protein CVU84_06815 [Firmicutes bacterium HGW-Firmicutes-1]